MTYFDDLIRPMYSSSKKKPTKKNGIYDDLYQGLSSLEEITERPKDLSSIIMEQSDDWLKPRKEKEIIMYKKDFIEKIFPKEIEYIIKTKYNNPEIKKYDLIDLIPSANLKINSKNYTPTGSFLGIGLKEDVRVNAENLPHFAEPIVDFVREMRPDYIIACDRGARFIGLAVKALYNELYGKLPTTDGTLRFRRISKSTDRAETKRYLKPLVEEMTRNRKEVRVLILDDWIVSGSTKQLIAELFEEMAPGKIKLNYGVLLGANADVSGNKDRTNAFANTVEWHDDSNLIGLDYSGTKPRVLMGKMAVDYRRRIIESSRQYAAEIRAKAGIKEDKEEEADKSGLLGKLKGRKK